MLGVADCECPLSVLIQSFKSSTAMNNTFGLFAAIAMNSLNRQNYFNTCKHTSNQRVFNDLGLINHLMNSKGIA